MALIESAATVTEFSPAKGPCFLLLDGADDDHPSRLEDRMKECEEEFSGVTLVHIHADDWMNDYAPWDYSDQQDLPRTAHAEEMIEALEKLRAQYPDRPCFPVGYSLAGLFALYAFYTSGCFDGFISCSGALWMDGFQEKVEAFSAPRHGTAYLSLGGKEEKSPNAKLARVGDNTRWFYQRMRQGPNLCCTLEMVKGGHFADADQRLLKGIRWIMSNLSSKN